MVKSVSTYNTCPFKTINANHSQALILSAGFNTSHREAQKSISLSTHGILFMGTPHAGSGGVSWGKLALNLASIVINTNPDYLAVLERNSHWLEQQQVQYNSISSRFDTKFFYEIYETQLPGGGKLLVSSLILPLFVSWPGD